LKIKFYGGAREVGRSAFLVTDGDSNLLLDAGVKLGAQGKEQFPLIRPRDARNIQSIAISHTHLDHVGFLPMLYKMGCKAQSYATKPTRDMTQLLLADYLRIQGRDAVFSQKDIGRAMAKMNMVEYKETVGKKLKFSFHNAGHILGSAITLVRGSRKLVYSADFNLTESMLLSPAEKKFTASTLLMESTYGGKQDQLPTTRQARAEFIKSIDTTLKKGGKVLIPSFAVGRGQEILFVLENYMRSGALEKVPIWVDGMIIKANRIYRHNVIYCKDEIQKRILMSDEDPFKSPLFKQPSTRGRSEVTRDGPAIIVSTSGMMSGGPAITYFKRLAADKKNKLILVGYQARGTLGNKLLSGDKQIEFNEELIRVNMSVEQVHFSAHADQKQLIEFAKGIRGLKKVILVHGDPRKQDELAPELRRLKYEVEIPGNGDTLRL